MALVHFISHPDVVVDPAVPVPRWPLSERGRERMHLALAQPWVEGIRAVHSSCEQKAIDGATILAAYLDLPVHTHAELGEIDRSATGYLPQPEFEAVADAFFARPLESVRGWERAIDAQARILVAIEYVLASPRPAGDIAIVSHGAVGGVLLCALSSVPISRAHDQPRNPPGGWHFAFDADTRGLLHGWQRIDD